MSDEGGDGGIVNRRDMFKAGVLGTGLAAYASLGTEEVQANHTTPTEPLITLGDSFELFADGDDAVIKHTPSGAHITYNQAQSRWEMDAPLHMTSQNVTGVGALTAGSIDNGGSPITQGDVLSRDGVSKGATSEGYRAEASDGSGVREQSQPTDGVSTSATAIYQFTGAATRAALITVIGIHQGSAAQFTDVVHAGRTAGSTTVVNSEEAVTPAGRTYTIDTGTDSLDLAMASDTYDITAEGTQVRVD